MSSTKVRALAENGYAIVPDVFSASECNDILPNLGTSGVQSAGSRCLLDNQWCRDLAGEVRDRLRPEFDFAEDLVFIQCTYFNKSAEKNWLVPWHQDRSIPVAEQVNSPELSGWSRKEGMTFVHAPESVWGQMLALRLHLDDSTQENGPLRVIPASHKGGTLTTSQIRMSYDAKRGTDCIVPKGGIVLMHPMLLHASSKGTSAQPRRVLHFLMAPRHIPDGLSWRQQHCK